MAGPLHGTRVLTTDSRGPVPFAGMMLADMGAEVIRIDQPGRAGRAVRDRSVLRGVRSICLDLKDPAVLEVSRRLIASADVLIEGYRPGVMERLGLGPEPCLAVTPRLVYVRVTGWGQDGPLASTAGHDINYIAVSGALDVIGRAGEAPVPPPALVGDFGGGGMLATVGVCAALLEARSSGVGQVVDVSCVDGASLQMTAIHSLRSQGQWNDERGTNTFDTGAPFYDVYETRDGRYVAFGALEAPFYAAMMGALGISDNDGMPQHDRTAWPRRRRMIANVVLTRTRDEWCERFAGVDACFSPVLDAASLHDFPQHRARAAFRRDAGMLEPAAAPRFSRSDQHPGAPPAVFGADTGALLDELGYTASDIEAMRARGVVG